MMGPDDKLPCDVMVPPRTIIRKGCKLSTLLEAIKHREGQGPHATMFSERATLPASERVTGGSDRE